MNFIQKQESPLAWTQEAYCPLRSNCSLCYSMPWWYPSPGWGGVTILIWLGGTPSWTGQDGYPVLGYPPPGQGYPSLVARLRHSLERPSDLGKNLELECPPERTWDQWTGKEPGTGVPPPRWWTDWKQKYIGGKCTLKHKGTFKRYGTIDPYWM